MAKNTPTSYRNLFIYQVYNRNHNSTGSFIEFIDDLDRIKDLGVDIVYLLPIHPIGKKKKKGSLGCPYSIQDYKEVNSEYGTLDDFKKLISEVHKRDMKIMIDVVFNHTSHDARLLKEHPEWYYKNDNGDFANRVGDWEDITDLDYSNTEMWDELIDTLKYWVNMGLDGYRCDVASIVPVDFWLRARKEVAEINPDFIWLAESVHGNFVTYIRSLGYEAHSDSEVYQAFDINYDYDVMEDFHNYINEKGSLETYLEKLRMQEYIYPGNYVKLRNLENHDQPRIASLVKDEYKLKNWTAFNFFQKGAAMIYGGQEAIDTNTPSLFDIDKVNWENYNKYGITDLIKKLAQIKKDEIMATGVYEIAKLNVDEVIMITYTNGNVKRVGLFNVGSKTGDLQIELPDGEYTNLLSDEEVTVEEGKIKLVKEPVIFNIK